jgi:hypothetical protein
MQCLDRKDDFYAHVLSLMHDLTINNHLISTDSVTDRICWIRSCRDLDLAPLTIGGHIFALGREVLELFVDALLLNAALSLDKWRFWRT